jgi:deoxyinosine 3'endonuclease (endonuclease V)
LALSNDNSKLTVYNGNQALAVIQKTLSKALIEEHYNAPKVDMDSITIPGFLHHRELVENAGSVIG